MRYAPRDIILTISRQKEIFNSLKNGIPFKYEKTDESQKNPWLDRVIQINKRTKASFDMPCSICGSSENIQMHHIKSVRKRKYKEINGNNYWEQIMSLRNRKQIPVCQNCHMNVIHAGKYFGPYKLKNIGVQNMYDNRIVNLENYVNKCIDPSIYIKSMEEKGWKRIYTQDKDYIMIQIKNQLKKKNDKIK